MGAFLIRARDRQALALAAGQARGVLAHLGLQAVGQALDEFQQVGGGERVADLLLARLAQRAVADVGGDGVVEQHHVLADQRQMRAQAAQRQVVDGHVVDQDGSGLGQHEARQHVHQRGLAAARAAHQRHGLAGLDGEGHVVQRVAVGVGEAMADASEFHAAAHRLGQRARALVDFRLLVDQREHAFGGHQHLLHAGGHVGQALDGIENLRQGGHERGEAAHGQEPLLAWLRATAITAPTEIEMQTWVNGVSAASAVVVRMAKRRSLPLTKAKRPRSTS